MEIRIRTVEGSIRVLPGKMKIITLIVGGKTVTLTHGDALMLAEVLAQMTGGV